MKLVKSFALIFFIAGAAVSFHSCTIKQNTGLLASSSTTASQTEVFLDNAPFAYDFAADTISYNSCVGENLDKTQIHGFKIGSNQGFIDSDATGAVQGGVKLRTEFLDYVGKNVKPNYPSTVIVPAQIQYLLKNSTKNSDGFIQYAIRNRSNLKVLVDTINFTTPVVLGRDGVIENTSLQVDSVVSDLTKSIVFGPKGVVLSEGQRVYNLQPKTNQAAPMEGVLRYNASVDETFPAASGFDDNLGAAEQHSDNVRKKFNSSSTDKVILAVTYGNPFSAAATAANDAGLNSPKQPSSGDATKAYGRAYELKFESLSAKAGWRQNRLTSVKETSLGGDTLGVGTWSCDNFVIMKKAHWNNPRPAEAGCAPLTASDLQDPVISAQVKKIRRHYSDENWNVGLFYAASATYLPATRVTHSICLVPKLQTECYLRTSGLTADGVDVGVQYDPDQECYLTRWESMGVTYTGGLTGDSARKLGRCAQYASVCSRQ